MPSTIPGRVVDDDARLEGRADRVHDALAAAKPMVAATGASDGAERHARGALGDVCRRVRRVRVQIGRRKPAESAMEGTQRYSPPRVVTTSASGWTNFGTSPGS